MDYLKKVDMQETNSIGNNLCPADYLNIPEIEDIKVKDTESLLNNNTI